MRKDWKRTLLAVLALVAIVLMIVMMSAQKFGLGNVYGMLFLLVTVAGIYVVMMQIATKQYKGYWDPNRDTGIEKESFNLKTEDEVDAYDAVQDRYWDRKEED